MYYGWNNTSWNIINSLNLLSITAASSAVLVRIPGTSKEWTNGISPCRDRSPYVGFSPTTPHQAAGQRVDPPVSEPSALLQRNKKQPLDISHKTLLPISTVKLKFFLCTVYVITFVAYKQHIWIPFFLYYTSSKRMNGPAVHPPKSCFFIMILKYGQTYIIKHILHQYFQKLWKHR